MCQSAALDLTTDAAPLEWSCWWSHCLQQLCSSGGLLHSAACPPGPRLLTTAGCNVSKQS